MKIDMEKALAELDVLRGFIDFVNSQVGVYMDFLAGFEGNTVRIQRQIARVQRPTGRKTENGKPVVMYASVEDPNQPDVTLLDRIYPEIDVGPASGETLVERALAFALGGLEALTKVEAGRPK